MPEAWRAICLRKREARPSADAGWATAAGLSGMGCFYDCPLLVGGAGTAYAASKISAAYFRIDGGPESATPGYLTAGA